MKNKTPKNKVTLETIADSIGKLDLKIGSLDKRLSRKIDDKIDELAISTANGFRDLEMRLTKKIDAVDIRVNSVEIKVDNLEAKLDHTAKNLNTKVDSLDAKIDDLNFYKVRDEVFFLNKRVTKVETKIGIKA